MIITHPIAYDVRPLTVYQVYDRLTGRIQGNYCSTQAAANRRAISLNELDNRHQFEVRAILI